MTVVARKKPLLSDYIRQQRYQKIHPYLGSTVLDLGCGRADLLATTTIKRYVGVDTRADFLATARANYPNHEFYQLDLEHQSLAEVLTIPFDTIVMTAFLEHLHNPASIVLQLPALLAQHGKIVATTPTPLGHKVHWLGAKVGLFYREAANEHFTIFSRSKLYQLLQAHQLKIAHYERFGFGCNQIIVATR